MAVVVNNCYCYPQKKFLTFKLSFGIIIIERMGEMKIFIWKRLGKVSPSYHCEGGAIVIAEDHFHAKELIDEHEHLKVEEDDWNEGVVVEYELFDNPEPRVIIFPDAGCC